MTRPQAIADPIAVVPYSDEWPTTFETLRAFVTNALGGAGRRVEHVGSTSVPGLPAKPIIDIDVVIEGDDQLDEVIERLTAVGYVFQGDKGVTGRYAFGSPRGSPDHHLYVCAEGSRELRRHLLFRDYLRRHREEAAAYGRLKQELARQNPADRIAYTDGKSEWIERALRRASRGTR